MPGLGENFNRNCHSVKSFSGKHMFYILIRKILKEKSSLSRADGSEEKVYKFVSWVEHKNPILAQEGRKFVQTNLQKFKCQGGCPGGMLKLRIDQHITCPTVGRESQGIKDNIPLFRSPKLVVGCVICSVVLKAVCFDMRISSDDNLNKLGCSIKLIPR